MFITMCSSEPCRKRVAEEHGDRLRREERRVAVQQARPEGAGDEDPAAQRGVGDDAGVGEAQHHLDQRDHRRPSATKRARQRRWRGGGRQRASGARREQAGVAAGRGGVDAEMPLEDVARRVDQPGHQRHDRPVAAGERPARAPAASPPAPRRRPARGRAGRSRLAGVDRPSSAATGSPASAASAAGAPAATASTALPAASACTACASTASAPAPRQQHPAARVQAQPVALAGRPRQVERRPRQRRGRRERRARRAGAPERRAERRDPVGPRRPAAGVERREGRGQRLGRDLRPARRRGRRLRRPALQPRQVVRPAGLRPGARQPLAAERLRADDGADLVAVDVDVAGVDAAPSPARPGRRCGCAARRSGRSRGR